MTDQKYRNELKYIISAGERVLLENRIKHLLSLDSHAGLDGRYNIRSLYFDDYNNTCFYENEDGTDPREKFRIRIYNGSKDKISLECKRKECGKTLKTSCALSIEQTEAFTNGRMPSAIEDMPPLMRKFAIEMQIHRLRPVVIVDYDRIPYVYRNGNVRITLDHNISSSKEISRFLEKTVSKKPVMPVGHQLLEVKYDEYLPDFIYRNLQLNNLRQTSFSKYYICRRFAG